MCSSSLQLLRRPEEGMFFKPTAGKLSTNLTHEPCASHHRLIRTMASGLSMRRRVSRCRIASADGPIGRIKIGCVFGILKGAYWITAAAQGRKADLAFASIVSDKYQFAFCGVPKVATKSIRAALLRTPEIAAFAVDRNAAALAAEDSPYRFHHRFSFVRNPWSRVV
jgi:hypothetical protein